MERNHNDTDIKNTISYVVIKFGCAVSSLKQSIES